MDLSNDRLGEMLQPLTFFSYYNIIRFTAPPGETDSFATASCTCSQHTQKGICGHVLALHMFNGGSFSPQDRLYEPTNAFSRRARSHNALRSNISRRTSLLDARIGDGVRNLANQHLPSLNEFFLTPIDSGAARVTAPLTSVQNQIAQEMERILEDVPPAHATSPMVHIEPEELVDEPGYESVDEPLRQHSNSEEQNQESPESAELIPKPPDSAALIREPPESEEPSRETPDGGGCGRERSKRNIRRPARYI